MSTDRETGRAAAQRRFAPSAVTAANADDLATREWVLEDLLDDPASVGRAKAAARFYGNRSAGDALADLDRAVRALRHYDDGGDAA